MSNPKRVLVLGATGLLGKPVKPASRAAGISDASTLRRPVITLEQYAEGLLAHGSFPSKRVQLSSP